MCEVSEKAIMLCKAAAMGDEASYSRIMATSDPRQAKSLGRRVRGFNEARWKRLVCGVAKEVCVRRQNLELDSSWLPAFAGPVICPVHRHVF